MVSRCLIYSRELCSSRQIQAHLLTSETRCPKTFDCEVSVRSTEIRALIVADDDTMPWSDD